jgi:hypothetical protein
MASSKSVPVTADHDHHPAPPPADVAPAKESDKLTKNPQKSSTMSDSFGPWHSYRVQSVNFLVKTAPGDTFNIVRFLGKLLQLCQQSDPSARFMAASDGGDASPLTTIAAVAAISSATETKK